MQHIARYPHEFVFRYSNPSALGVDDSERATRAISGADGKRLLYRQPRSPACSVHVAVRAPSVVLFPQGYIGRRHRVMTWSKHRPRKQPSPMRRHTIPSSRHLRMSRE